MDIEGCLIVADALNCHQKAAEAVVAGKADYLLDVRANQRNLEEEIAEYVKNDDLRGRMDKNRERIEIRTAYTTDDAEWLCGKEKMEGAVLHRRNPKGSRS